MTPLKKKIPIKTFEMFLFRKFLFYKSMIKAEISIIIFLRQITILLVFQIINSEVHRRCLKKLTYYSETTMFRFVFPQKFFLGCHFLYEYLGFE